VPRSSRDRISSLDNDAYRAIEVNNKLG